MFQRNTSVVFFLVLASTACGDDADGALQGDAGGASSMDTEAGGDVLDGGEGDDATTDVSDDQADADGDAAITPTRDAATDIGDASALPGSDAAPDDAPDDDSATLDDETDDSSVDDGNVDDTPTDDRPTDDRPIDDSSSDDGSGVEFEAGTPGDIGHQAIDLAALDGVDGFARVSGTPEGDGTLGVPVAASHDIDGDGHIDAAMSAFTASPQGRTGAGQVYVVFGDGEINDIDLEQQPDSLLMVYGDGNYEGTGSEVWMSDVTGDGIGDLLICRQNYRPSNPDRIGAGALTIVVGGEHLRQQLESGQAIDLRQPPESLPIVTIIGGHELGRFGIWVRTGDVTADGVDDLVVGADQESAAGETYRGASYVIRGGEHLEESLVVDLIDFGSTPLAGSIAKLTPPAGQSAGYHFGATVGIADLDQNGRAEVISTAAIVRSGASYVAEDGPVGSAIAQGGAPGGRSYIAWDDNFPQGEWPDGYTIDVGDPPGSVTTLLPGEVGDLRDRQLGEEIVGGEDYDGDGRPDLFIGDMTGVAGQGRANAGLGYVIYDAAALKERTELVLLDPGDVPVTVLRGPSAGAIFADTAAHADIDGDGLTDLIIASPNDSPLGRTQAGTVHVLWGSPQRWPSEIDLTAKPSAVDVQITELFGVRGAAGGDGGDMLSYSADVGDIDGDGRIDLIVNEMGGNGVSPAAVDAGNYLIVSSAIVSRNRPDCSGVIGGEARVDACGVCAGGGTGVEPDVGCTSFQREVRPLLVGECSSCHGNAAGLSVFTHELLMQGASDNGPVVLPGDPDGSLLIQKLEARQLVGDPMPPEYRLTDDEIAVVRRWITEGARDN